MDNADFKVPLGNTGICGSVEPKDLVKGWRGKRFGSYQSLRRTSRELIKEIKKVLSDVERE